MKECFELQNKGESVLNRESCFRPMISVSRMVNQEEEVVVL